MSKNKKKYFKKSSENEHFYSREILLYFAWACLRNEASWGHPSQAAKLPIMSTEISAFAKFRCGVAPIRIETGRYEGLSIEERICPFCSDIEDEKHVLLDCKVYNDLRTSLLDKALYTTQKMFCIT